MLLSANRQTILFRRFSKKYKISKKVAERSRNSRRRSRDRRRTVKQLFWRINHNGKISKKVTGHAIVVWWSRWLSNNFFDVSAKIATFWEKSLGGQATVGGHTTFSYVLTRMTKFWKNIAERWSEVTRSSADRGVTFDGCRLTVQRFFKNVVISADTSNKILTVDWRSPAA